MQYNTATISISADSHVDLGYLPWDLFTSQAPPRYADRVPRVESCSTGRHPSNSVITWWAGPLTLSAVGTYLDPIEDVGHFSKVPGSLITPAHPSPTNQA